MAQIMFYKNDVSQLFLSEKNYEFCYEVNYHYQNETPTQFADFIIDGMTGLVCILFQNQIMFNSKHNEASLLLRYSSENLVKLHKSLTTQSFSKFTE